jgi:hypothetical protein
VKKAILLLFILAICLQPQVGISQEQTRIYLPFVSAQRRDCMPRKFLPMSDWKIVVPEATINNVLNPSAEIAANFAAEGAAVVTRVTTTSRYGVYSYRVQTAANNQGIQFTLNALANAIHYVTLRVSGTLPAAWDWSLDNVAYTAPVLLEALDGTWSVYGLQFPAAQANGSTRLRVHQNGAGAGDFNLDGIQVEEKTDWTTYCDGDQQGCEWLGAEHASQSQRSAVSRAGGSVNDLQDDYNFLIGGMIGTGMAPLDLVIDHYAILPGGQLNSTKVLSSRFTLTGPEQSLTPQNLANLHAARQSLLNVLKPDAVPETAEGAQPIILRYEGAIVHKEIEAHYLAGLEANIVAEMECWEQDFAVRFVAPGSFWGEIGESAQVLDTNDSATFRLIAGRLRSTGQWDDLGPPAAPGIAVYNSVQDIAVGPDGNIYIGGSFSSFDNIVAANNIVMYNPQTDTYSALGAAGLNAQVNTLKFGPDGMLYIGGLFTAAGGDLLADYFCTWDGAVFNNLGDPDSGGAAIVSVIDIDIALNGDIYVVGEFATFAGVAGADRVVFYDISAGAWALVVAGASATVQSIGIAPNGTDIYFCGNFTNWGDADGDYIVRWDGALNSLLTGLSNPAFDVKVANDGTVYVGGDFATAGGTTVNKIASWNGNSFQALGAGVSGAGIVYRILIAPDGIIYAGGSFTNIWGLAVADRVAKWNGSSGAHLDINLPGALSTFALAAGLPDPVIEQNYDLWVGFTTTGAGDFAGTATVTNDGTRTAFPLFVVSRVGGTEATLEQLRNETTGKELLFDYDLLDGETLTVDLRPTQKSIVSNFFGVRPDAILANSDFGEWALLPGNNQVTCFVDVAGAPTIVGYLLWEDTFWSFD